MTARPTGSHHQQTSADTEPATLFAEVVDIVDKSAGPVVHLRIPPGQLEDYQTVIPA